MLFKMGGKGARFEEKCGVGVGGKGGEEEEERKKEIWGGKMIVRLVSCGFPLARFIKLCTFLKGPGMRGKLLLPSHSHLRDTGLCRRLKAYSSFSKSSFHRRFSDSNHT